MNGQGTKCRRDIAENLKRLSRAHERYRRQTTDGRAIAYKPRGQTSRNFLCMLTVTVARSPSDDSAVRYVLPVLWMTSCFHMARGVGNNDDGAPAYSDSAAVSRTDEHNTTVAWIEVAVSLHAV